MNTHHYVHYSSKNLNANLSNDYKPVVIAIKIAIIIILAISGKSRIRKMRT